MSKEIELKFEIEQPSIAALSNFIKTQNVSDQQLLHLTNTYYDSIDNQLQNNGISLRIRSIHEERKTILHEITLKSSGTAVAGLHSRNEFNVYLPDDQINLSVLPENIFPQHIDITKLSCQLVALFTTNFYRQTWLVVFGESEIEIALDQGHIHTSTLSTSIQEVELELKSGNQRDLLLFATKLSQFNLHLFSQSKAARGYRLLQSSALTKISKLEVDRLVLSSALTDILQYWQLNEEHTLDIKDLIAYKEILSHVQCHLVQALSHLAQDEFDELKQTFSHWSEQIKTIENAKVFAFSATNTKLKLLLMLALNQ